MTILRDYPRTAGALAATPLMRLCASLAALVAIGSILGCSHTSEPRTIGPIALDSIGLLAEGDSASLRVSGASLQGIATQWRSSDPSVVDVSSAGNLLARSSGTAIISVKAANQSAATLVTVKRHVLPDLFVIAHRGFAGVFPENTLTAVRGAFDRGADAVEVDVMMAKDRVPVIIHDDRVDRTTNGTGLVSSYTSTQLQQLDACSKFGSQWAPCPVPLAREVMEAARGRGRLLLHLKGPWPPGALDTLLELVRTEQIRSQAVVIDFDTVTLKHVRSVDPGIPVGLLSLQMVDPQVLQRLGDAAVLLYDSTFLASPAGTTSNLRARALEGGNAIGAWTISNLSRAKSLRASGSGWMITDVELPKDTLAIIPVP